MGCTNRNRDDERCGDEGRLCRACEEKEHAYWGRYFGLSADMTPEERRQRLNAFAPPGRELPEEA